MIESERVEEALKQIELEDFEGFVEYVRTYMKKAHRNG